jgi:hypothetical protein
MLMFVVVNSQVLQSIQKLGESVVQSVEEAQVHSLAQSQIFCDPKLVCPLSRSCVNNEVQVQLGSSMQTSVDSTISSACCSHCCPRISFNSSTHVLKLGPTADNSKFCYHVCPIVTVPQCNNYSIIRDPVTDCVIGYKCICPVIQPCNNATSHNHQQIYTGIVNGCPVYQCKSCPAITAIRCPNNRVASPTYSPNKCPVYSCPPCSSCSGSLSDVGFNNYYCLFNYFGVTRFCPLDS